MASKKTLTAENLEALGAPRLAALLLETTSHDAAARRRLRLELAAHESPERVAAEVRKRLSQIERSRSFAADWRQVRALATDLETQRRAIVERVATIDAGDALELMWRFLELASSVYQRSDDSNGEIGSVFETACSDVGPLAEKAKTDPLALADRTFEALEDDSYGEYDGLLGALAPVLGRAGLDRLKARFVELSRTPVIKPPADQRRIIGVGPGGPMYADEIEASRRSSTGRAVLQQIADLQGDVDGFIAQHGEAARKVPGIAAEIAQRLLAAGRAVEALGMLEAAERPRKNWPEFEWQDARIAVLDALDRGDEAQAERWTCFESHLSARHLRAWLDRLPDFEDDAGERRALEHAERRKNLLQGLAFLVDWKALDRAACLVTARAQELDGNRYEILAPAAEALAEAHPLAATLLLRAMVEFALTKAGAGRYAHASRHYGQCGSLAASIPDFAPFETHESWAASVKARHGRKWGFWSLVP